MIGGRGGVAGEKREEKLTGLVRSAGRSPHRQITWVGGAVCRSAVYCTAGAHAEVVVLVLGSVGKRCGQQGEGGVRENVAAGIIVWWCVMTGQRAPADSEREGRL